MNKRVALSLCLMSLLLVGCNSSPKSRAAKHLQRGAALNAKKDYARAAIELRNAIRLAPEDAEAHYQLGLTHLGAKDVQAAYRSFRRATELNPGHTGAQLKYAELLSLSGSKDLLEQAISRVTEVFGASPDNSEAISVLALAEWKVGQREEAVRLLEESIGRFPANLETSVTLARMKLGRKDFTGAEEVLLQAVTRAPQSALPLVALGRLYLLLGKLEKAEQQLQRAIQLDAKSGPALSSIARIQVATGRLDAAEQTYKQLAALHDARYQASHATFLYQTGKREAAVAEFEGLVKGQPEDRELRNQLVGAYIAMDRIQDAENVLGNALKRNPKDVDALLQRAELHLRAGKPDLADNDLKTVVRFNRNSAPAHFLLAAVYGKTGLAKNREQELQEALRLNPALLPARLALETAHLEARQPKAALDVIDAAPASQKELLQWQLGRNSALLAVGDLKEAKLGIERALRAGRRPEAVEQSAILRLAQHDIAGARAELDELLRSGKPNVRVAEIMMESYAAQKDVARGMSRLKQLAASNPGSGGLQYLLGKWSLRSGDTGGAQKAFEAALTADPRSTAPELALAEIDITAGRYEAGVQRLGRVIAAEPANVRALLLSAQAEDAGGKPDAATSNYRAVLAVDPSNLVALNNLAYLLAPTAADEALALAQKAAEIAPDQASIQDTLGWVYYRKGLYSMAMRHLKNAVERESTAIRQYHLGLSYLKVGERSAGQRMVEEALSKDPSVAKTAQAW
jgi:putative PEP-CTERM system TPR-repeat lipoprotein